MCFSCRRNYILWIQDLRQGLTAATRPSSRPPDMPAAPENPPAWNVPLDAELLPPFPASHRSHASTSTRPPRRPTYKRLAARQLDTNPQLGLRGCKTSLSHAALLACPESAAPLAFVRDASTTAMGAMLQTTGSKHLAAASILLEDVYGATEI